MKIGDTVQIRNYRDPEIASMKGVIMRYDDKWVYLKIEPIGGLFRFNKDDCEVIEK